MNCGGAMPTTLSKAWKLFFEIHGPTRERDIETRASRSEDALDVACRRSGATLVRISGKRDPTPTLARNALSNDNVAVVAVKWTALASNVMPKDVPTSPQRFDARAA